MVWLVVMVLCVSEVSVAKSQDVFKIADVIVQPSSREDVYLNTLSGDNDPAAIIPVTVIHGAKHGPVLAVVAGIHGYEYTSIIAVNQWVKQLKPDTLSGTVVIVRLAHVPAFEERSIYVNPYDRKNLNRSFPGSVDGSQTERIAWAISNQVVAQSDFLIDLHSGDGGEWLTPFIGVYGGPLSSNLPLALSVAQGFNFPNIVEYKMKTQQQVDTRRSLNRQGVAEKIPTILVEIGEHGSRNINDVNAMISGLENTLSVLKINDKDADISDVNRRYFDGTNAVPVKHSGLWFPAVTSGQWIKQGQLLGELQDYFGRTVETIHSPSAGYSLYGLAGPAVKKGQSIMTIAKPVARVSD